MIESKPQKQHVIAKAEPEKAVGLTLDELRLFIATADAAGIPGDTPLTNPGVTLRGRLHRIAVQAIPR